MHFKFGQKIINKIRNKKVQNKEIYEIMFDNYCNINTINNIIDTPEGIKFKYKNNTLQTIKACIYEVFIRKDYNIDCNKQSILIDVGMNVGTTSLFFANKDYITKCYGFEPCLTTYNDAIININLNENIKDIIQTFNYGLGSETQKVNIKYNPQKSACASIYDDINDFGEDVSLLENECITIKNAYTEIQKNLDLHSNENIILKVDTEGAEYEIFKCLDSTDILDYINIVYIEWHKYTPDILKQILLKHNFAIKFIPEITSQTYGGLILGVNLCK